MEPNSCSTRVKKLIKMWLPGGGVSSLSLIFS